MQDSKSPLSEPNITTDFGMTNEQAQFTLDQVLRSCHLAPNPYTMEELNRRTTFAMRASHWLRILSICSIVLLLILPFFLLTPAVSDPVITASKNQTIATFSAYSVLPGMHITADIDGTSVPCLRIGAHQYQITILEEGELTISAHALNPRTESISCEVRPLHQKPSVIDHWTDGSYVYFQLKSGSFDLDYSNCYLLTFDGTRIDPVVIDTDAQQIAFDAPEESVTLVITDVQGSTVTGILDPEH